MVHSLKLALLAIVFLASTLPTLAQLPDDIAALKELAESAPEVVNVDPSPAQTPDFKHRLLLNPVGGLSGELHFLDKTSEGSLVRVLLTLDGKLLALPLKIDKRFGDWRGSFPTPFSSLQYQLQVISGKDSIISPVFRANPQCRASSPQEERFTGENELISQIRMLRNDSELLGATTKRIEVILGK